ncbi:hypothetical protein J437_LFUL005154 [Ladona fulva]|uniref:Ion transport domain-containing protein n=1 Tax=Ladona fulva TaxID=123851 RepID=A0A8K0KGL3_LADFU|nr:hypothetical protein J437_LFUL005154 [Ladona fulva]
MPCGDWISTPRANGGTIDPASQRWCGVSSLTWETGPEISEWPSIKQHRTTLRKEAQGFEAGSFTNRRARSHKRRQPPSPRVSVSVRRRGHRQEAKMTEHQRQASTASNAQSQASMASEMMQRHNEKRFLLFAERGDCASVRRMLDDAKNNPGTLDINCVDPLNRTALIAAIENENIELIHILLEYEAQVKEMRAEVQTFATSLLDHARTSHELEVMLNHNPDGEPWEPGERQTLERLKLAIKYKQKASNTEIFAITVLLGLASQRAEYLVIEWFGTAWMQTILEDWKRRERGSLPGLVESMAVLYVLMTSLWEEGLLEYIADLWNIVDWISNIFYTIWIVLRAVSWFLAQREYWNGGNPWYPREEWDPFDPMLLSEGAFAAGMIFSFLKLVHIFSVNPHLGPLQISLGRMVIDIIKFFFIYTLVLFAFGCGMNQLLWYYADLEKKRCYHLPSGLADFDQEELACSIWRRFANMFETSQSLFWASFGLVDLTAFELTGVKSFTRFWALLMFGSYSVINVIVLLNMLIAMMSNSYQIISERSDTEWKFARSKLWMSYFEEGDILPPPFNLMPSPTMLGLKKKKAPSGSVIRKSRATAQERHDIIMTLLVRRYVTAEQRKRDEFGITEDDVMEIRQDISTLRYELIDILKNNNFKTPEMDGKETTLAGKKGRTMERRLLKDFQIGFVEGVVNEVIKSQDAPKDVFSKIAKAIGNKKGSKKDWNAEVRRRTTRRDPIGSTSEATMRRSQQSLRRHIIQNENTALKNMDQEKLMQYNPKLNVVPPAARVAYAKFKMNKIKQEYDETGGDAAAEDDQVFKEGTDAKAGTAAAPKAGDKPSVSSAAAVAFRSRPQSKSAQDGTGTERGAAAPSGSSAKAPAPAAPAAKPEPPKPAPPKEPPKKPDSVVVDMEPKVEATKTPEAAKPPPPKEPPKPDPPKPKEEPKKEEPKKEEPKKDEPKKEEKKPPSIKEPSPSSSPDTSAKSSSPAASEQSTIPARTPEPIRPGKSKVTGEVLTGWL